MKSIKFAAFAAALSLAFSPVAAIAGNYHLPILHFYHVVKPPAASPSSQGPFKSSSGGRNFLAPSIGFGIFACINARALYEKSKAKTINGVKRTTYRQEAAIFGDCLIPIPVKVDGKWRTVGAEFFWAIGGRRKGYADPDFAIKQQEKRDRYY